MYIQYGKLCVKDLIQDEKDQDFRWLVKRMRQFETDLNYVMIFLLLIHSAIYKFDWA